MTYPFNGSVIEAYFTDPDLKNVTVIYEGQDSEGDTKAFEYNMTSDADDPRFAALLEDVSYDQIDTWTRSRHERHREQFREAFQDYADRTNLTASDSTYAMERFLDFFFAFDEEAHKEDLFKLKLAVFDKEHVRESTNKKLKTSIRKSSSPEEVFRHYKKSLK